MDIDEEPPSQLPAWENEVDCPACGMKAGQACRKTGQWEKSASHLMRLEAFIKHVNDGEREW